MTSRTRRREPVNERRWRFFTGSRRRRGGPYNRRSPDRIQRALRVSPAQRVTTYETYDFTELLSELSFSGAPINNSWKCVQSRARVKMELLSIIIVRGTTFYLFFI